MEKHYIGAAELLEDSYKLAWKVYESGYRPNYLVGVWRGGAPVGIAVQELFDVLGVESDHIAIRTSYYSSLGKTNDSVQVYGLSYLIKKLESEDSLLIVDDVFDTGKSIDQIIIDLSTACKKIHLKFVLQPLISSPQKIKHIESLIIFCTKLINGLYFRMNLRVLLPMN